MSLDVYLIDRSVPVGEGIEVYSASITHNLNKMATAAGIYDEVWRPDEHEITRAAQLIEPLTKGLTWLKLAPEHFKTFDAPNGWGLHQHLVSFLERYLAACKENPTAEVGVSR